jgi:hypothetical protein
VYAITSLLSACGHACVTVQLRRRQYRREATDLPLADYLSRCRVWHCTARVNCGTHVGGRLFRTSGHVADGRSSCLHRCPKSLQRVSCDGFKSELSWRPFPCRHEPRDAASGAAGQHHACRCLDPGAEGMRTPVAYDEFQRRLFQVLHSREEHKASAVAAHTAFSVEGGCLTRSRSCRREPTRMTRRHGGSKTWSSTGYAVSSVPSATAWHGAHQATTADMSSRSAAMPHPARWRESPGCLTNSPPRPGCPQREASGCSMT